MTAAPKRTEDACMIWGGFPVGDLVRVRLHLKRQHLEDKVLIQDRFGPERFIAYLGPYDNPTAARAFVKQFRQQGYGTVRPILSGELSYGVEIASFGTRKEAEAFLTGRTARHEGNQNYQPAGGTHRYGGSRLSKSDERRDPSAAVAARALPENAH